MPGLLLADRNDLIGEVWHARSGLDGMGYPGQPSSRAMRGPRPLVFVDPALLEAELAESANGGRLLEAAVAWLRHLGIIKRGGQLW